METRDQTVVHILDQHASILNDTLQLSRSNLILLQELQLQSNNLAQRVDYVLDYIQSSELQHFQQMQYFEELDSTFATLEHVLNLVQQQLEAWDIGFSALATGHLSPQIVSPTSLQQAIKEINTHLPLEYCQTQFVQWNGPEEAYLGLNRWAFSATEAHTVVFSCPPDGKHLPPQRRQLPPIGYFEVPSGCTARTDHWIFPASLEGSSTLAAIPSQTFNFEGMHPNITLEKAATVIHFLSLNLTHLNHVSNLLVQQSTLEAQASMTHNQIVTLLAAQKSLPRQSPYPYEWMAAFCFLSFCLASLAGFTWRLAKQFQAHVQQSTGFYEITDPVLPPRQPDFTETTLPATHTIHL
ncbi:hypothetical protein GHT06_020539 [Daphnia sinensis]|uniref:Uncharacterized protein n=1 Tax=Daphnia sinensis TaxID=1820382 RepID=A0AAD5KHW0_9CRUS|nr:hypothetical protein GHT06_020539 [Daphnia sinensis]